MLPGIDLPFMGFEFKNSKPFHSSLIMRYLFNIRENPSCLVPDEIEEYESKEWLSDDEFVLSLACSPSEHLLKLILPHAASDEREYIQQILQIYAESHKHVPMLLQSGLMNVTSEVSEKMQKDLGDASSNWLQYCDRHRRYGIVDVERTSAPQSLTEEIAHRPGVAFSCAPSEYPNAEVLSSLVELERFPLLVLIERNSFAAQELDEISSHLMETIPSSQQSVLSRTPGHEPRFNNLVKSRGLNNWVDEHTQVVYIFGDCLPKALDSSDWKPMACLVNRRLITSTKVSQYMERNCDLIVYREESESLYRKHSKKFKFY